ncbi:MAG: entericidin A/B family lipoprotein [Phycisphaerales bacterium]
MKSAIKRVLLLSCCAAALSLVACNTVEGVGKDIQKGGEKLENAAK